jgi:transposase
VARRHGIKPSLLFRWRRMARSTPCDPPEAAFLPVTLALPPVMAERTVPKANPHPLSSVHKVAPPCTDDRIEIELANGRLVRVGAGIDAAALKRILDVLKSR